MKMKEKEGELVRLLVDHSDEKKSLKGRIATLEARLTEVRHGQKSELYNTFIHFSFHRFL